MVQRAHVTSAEALEAFRAKLIVYLGQARSALEEISSDVLRMRMWLENDQRMFWEKEMRQRSRVLEEAQSALFSARISSLQRGNSVEQLAVQRAKRSVEEADNKLRILKRWNRDFEGHVQPLVKQMEKMHTLLTNDMVKATASLNQTITTLASYAEIAVPTDLAAGAAAAPKTDVPDEPGGNLGSSATPGQGGTA